MSAERDGPVIMLTARDMLRTPNSSRMRSNTDQLREALIGSVSHELRTPLASILGAATVLSAAPALQGEKKLQALVHDVRDEAIRLNNDIQNLLDATRISSDGVKPHTEWADPEDIMSLYGQLESRGRQALEADGFPSDDSVLLRTADLLTRLYPPLRRPARGTRRPAPRQPAHHPVGGAFAQKFLCF